MAVAATGSVIHLPFGERPQYGSPYPEGIAAGHLNPTGDATGGDITFTFLADAGFLYRFEGFQIARGSATRKFAHCISSHRWASSRSGLGASAFDLNWVLGADVVDTFSVYKMVGERSTGATGGAATTYDRDTVRRLPMGRTDAAILQTLFSATIVLGNIDTITHEAALWLTYWRKESLALPGFLSSFFEAPIVPTPLRVGT